MASETPQNAPIESSNRLYAANLAWSLTDETLKENFEKFGKK